MWDGHLGCCVKKRQNKLLAKCSLGICSIHLCVCRSGQRTTVRWVGNRRIICVNRWGAIARWGACRVTICCLASLTEL